MIGPHVTAILALLTLSATPVKAAGLILIQPGYGPQIGGQPYGVPGGTYYPPNSPVMPPQLSSPMLGGYPPGAQTCVAADQICPASAPNTVGNRCDCPGRDGQPVPGIVH